MSDSIRTVQEIYDDIINLEKEMARRLLSEAQGMIELRYYLDADDYKKNNFLPLWVRARLLHDTTLEVAWHRQSPWGNDKKTVRKEGIRKPRGMHKIPLSAFGRFPSPLLKQMVAQTEDGLELIRKVAAKHGKARRAVYEAYKSMAFLTGEPFSGRQTAGDGNADVDGDEG